MRKVLFLTFMLIQIHQTMGITPKIKADLIIRQAVIYTASSENPFIAEAMAVRDGRILAVGTSKEIGEKYDADRVIDLGGRTVMPGFIDAHAHFSGYAEGLQYTDLTGCRSFGEVLGRLKERGAVPEGAWIVGRGWDQNLWPEKTFPDNGELSRIYPNNPVMLIRIDGHAVLANQSALGMAGFKPGDPAGKAQVWEREGRLTGILTETAADRMREAVPKPERNLMTRLLRQAEENCFSVGLTTVCDAGLEADQVEMLDSLGRSGRLTIHTYVMLTPSERTMKKFLSEGPLLTEKLTVRSIKIYADGSLGSRTALLKRPYADEPGTSGILVTATDSIEALCEVALESGFQVNTHCIGDSACRLVLGVYGRFLKEKNDLRWRIEHAQVVDPADLPLFTKFSVVPSIQATHATSDMNWAGNRLGPERMKGAYAYQSLLQATGWIANGTDFPIEDISPLRTFYAAVTRRDINGNPPERFLRREALDRSQALWSVTLWAARACFLDKRKGSLDPGKDADFVVLDRNIMEVPESQLPGAQALETYIGGKQVWKRVP